MNRLVRFKRYLLTVLAALPAALLWTADFITCSIKAAFCILLVLLVPAPMSVASLVGNMRAKSSSTTGNSSSSSSVSGGSSTDSTASALAERQYLVRATQTIAAVRAAQAAARAAAKSAASTVPNGLTSGGLVVASGVSTNSSLWQNADLPTQATSGGETTVTVNQTASKAILTWDSFNVGRETTLNFDQQGNTDWIALNRVTDPSGSPSQILGQIKADGQVYIINRNGIIFGGASQVNVHTLVASSLSLSNEQFMAGINNPSTIAVDQSGNNAVMPVFGDHATTYSTTSAWAAADQSAPGDVVVEAGAQISGGSGGKLMLFAPRVSNAGTLNATDGQIILAAGEQIWLAEDQNGVRGLDIAVSGPLPYLMTYSQVMALFGYATDYNSGFTTKMRNIVLPAMEARAIELGYNVTNTGVISSSRGNITLQSREVNQNGVITASTALNNQDGSIRLRAWGQGMVADAVNTIDSGENAAVSWSAGTLTLGENSVCLILPDASDTSEIEITDVATRYTPGSIRLDGKLIDMMTGSVVMVPSGEIDIVAATQPFQRDNVSNPSVGPSIEPAGSYTTSKDGSRIYIDSGAVVSTAGLLEVEIDMARNFIEVDLRINELRDSPLIYDSWLYGETIVVDRRDSGIFKYGPMAGVLWGGDAGVWQGTPLADVSAWIGVGKTDLLELSTTGGTINLRSGGSIITREGSLLDVSGGSVHYTDGWNTASRLLGTDGKIYTIATATSDMSYVSFVGGFTVTSERWGVSETYYSPLISRKTPEAGYSEGRNAGSIQIYVSEGLVMEGDLAGGVITGARQLADNSAATAGSLVVGGASNEVRAWILGKLIITDTPVKLAEDFTATTALSSLYYDSSTATKSTWLDAKILEESQLGTISLYVSNGFTLEAGTDLELAAQTQLTVAGNVGSNNTTVFNVEGSIHISGGRVFLSNSEGSGSIVLGDGVVIDVSGQWINELMDGMADSIAVLNGGSISLGASSGTVGEGVVLDVSGGGRVSLDGNSSKLTVGDAGSISVGGFDSEDLGNLEFLAYAAGSGGSLGVTVAGALQIGGEMPGAGVLYLPTDLYASFGFSSVTVGANGIEIPDGVQVSLVPLGWDLTDLDYTVLPSGSKLSSVLSPTLLRAEERIERAKVSLNLTSYNSGDIRLGVGATIHVDTGGSVSMGTVEPHGGIAVGAGNITILGTIDAPAGSISLAAVGALTLAEGSSLLARGAAVIYEDAYGMRQGTVLDGGSVSLGATGLLTLAKGSLIDVSGTSAEVDYLDGDSSFHHEILSQSLASDGGAIEIGLGTLGGTVDADLLGFAGGDSAAGGSLTLDDGSVSSGSGILLSKALSTYIWYESAPGVFTRMRSTTSTTIYDLDVFNEYEGAVTMSSTMRSALNALPLNAAKTDGLILTDGSLEDAVGIASTLNSWEYDANIDSKVVDLLNKYFWYDAGTTKINIGNITAISIGSVVSSKAIQNGGFSNVSLQSKNGVMLSSGVNLKVNGSVIINAPVLNNNRVDGSSSIQANYIALDPYGSAKVAAAAIRVGQLSLEAPVIDVVGGSSDTDFGIRGYESVEIETSELRFTVGKYYAGSTAKSVLNVDGTLTIVAGHVYPATAVAATINADESIIVRSNGETFSTPLSAGGSLTLNAPVIEQYGVLLAPFGQITLEASERLVLGEGSMTSVSGDGLLVPYGSLMNNEYWADPLTSATSSGISELPDKKIVLSAPVVETNEGAIIDIRGGGDLYANEFVEGTGGSHNIMTTAGAYAIIPGYDSIASPGGSGISVGSRIWLSGGDGLAAGWYTLLPASYAALPGAYLILPTGMTSPLGMSVSSTAQSDGSVIMTGRQANGVSGASDQYSSFWQVMSSEQLRQYSEYNEALASDFFGSDAFKTTQYRLTGVNIVTPRLTTDAGSVVFKATEQLVLDGTLWAQAGDGGKGGLVDIEADKIAIVGADQDTADLAAQNFLILNADALSSFGASSLLIGGSRSNDSLGLALDVGASEVVVRNSSSSILSGAEIILAATDKVSIEAGSVIQASGDGGDTADLIIKPEVAAVYSDNGTSSDTTDDILVSAARDWGALVRLSNAGAVQVIRQGVDTTTGGLVSIGEGAALAGGQASLIDSTRTTEMADSARLSGQSLSISAGRVGLGGGTEGLILSGATLLQLANTGELTLRSYTSIDFYETMDFRDSGLTRVILDAASLAGYGGDVLLDGETLTLINSSAVITASGADGRGRLSLAADQLMLGEGSKTIQGFASVELTGRERIVALDKGQLDAGSSIVTLNTPLLTGEDGASLSVVTTGALTLTGDSSQTVEGLGYSLGVSLALSGGTLNVNGRIVALGGSVKLNAQTGDLVLGDQALIDVGGFAKDFYDVFEYADAGSIELTAGGSIVQAVNSRMNLSADTGGGNAGTLTVTTSSADSTIALDGQISAQAGLDGEGGSFVMDVGELPGFAALSQHLNEAGFSVSREFRVRTGDVTVDGLTTVEDFSLTADQGTVTLVGTIDARSLYGGLISISGGNGVTMTSGALLTAGATDAELGSGRVLLDAGAGQLNLQGGTINVAGGEGGRVRLRALQTAGHDEIAVAALNADLVGARSAVLEGVAVYESNSVNAVKDQAVADAATFANHAGDIAARLGNGSVEVMPGIEIRSAGDLTLETDWNLFTTLGTGMREGGLTLRAAGNLVILGNLSDGFDTAGKTGVLQSTSSWDLRLVAGADLTSSDILSVQSANAVAADSGSVIVGTSTTGYVIRTGVGDLDVSAARDVDLLNEGSAIYTAGRADTTVWEDFTTIPALVKLNGSTAVLTSLLTAAYGIEGGYLSMSAGGDINGSMDSVATATVFDWLRRLGRLVDLTSSSAATPFRDHEQSTWFVDYALFDRGVGALGGGNVSLRADGDIDNLLVAQPTNGRVRGGRTAGEEKVLELRNGGAMSIIAGGAVSGGEYYIGRGTGTINAQTLAVSTGAGAAPVLALGDTVFQVITKGDLALTTVIDPLMRSLADQNGNGTAAPSISGYTDNTSLDLFSVSGDIVLGAGKRNQAESVTGSIDCQDLYPSITHMTAFNGSIDNEQGVWDYYFDGINSQYTSKNTGLLFLMPGSQTDLSLLAEDDILLGMVATSRISPEVMPSPFMPVLLLSVHFMVIHDESVGTWPIGSNTDEDWTAADDDPSRIYTRSGDIVRNVAGYISSGEQLWIRAGNDIRGLRLDLRNNHATDVSLVEAGNDIIGLSSNSYLNRVSNPFINADITIQGPGNLLILAGHDVYNINAKSLGNYAEWDDDNLPIEKSRINYLPDEGASITVMAGLNGQQPDYAAYLATYLDPAKVASMPSYLVTTLANGTTVPLYLVDGDDNTVRRGLVSFIEEVTGETLDPLAAWARFQALPTLTQQVFIRQVFMQELRDAGRNQNESGEGGLPLNGGYNRGYAAIATLFPGDNWDGDVVADSMTLRTMLGGNINILTPGGGLQVASLVKTPKVGEGIITLAGGNIGIFAQDSIVVNSSRILTFVPEATTQGSDMIIWSSVGDVDAGRGAKTVRAPSAPIVDTDVDGNTTVTERSDMSGSGIGTIGDGDVDLVAPYGTVNAGDAGIRVAGNLNIAALYVLNADNIQVSGEKKGVPEPPAAPDMGGMIAATSSAAAASASSQDALQPHTPPTQQALPSIFRVQVLGFGMDGQDPYGNGTTQVPNGDTQVIFAKLNP